MSKSKKHLNICIIIVALSFLTFNDLGIVKLITIYSDRKMIEDEIQILIAEQNELLVEIKLLETNEEYIKKVALEEFYMANPGEIIYRVQRDKTIE